MSRELPAKPSLESLRKQAKQIQRTTPSGKLTEAQHALAREYGFASWAKLKSHVVTLGLPPAEALTVAVRDQDAQRVQDLLAGHPALKQAIDEPLPDYGLGINALYAAVQRSDRATIDVLLRAGAQICKRTDWWAGGFGVLDECDPGMVGFLLERGAVIDAHSAARLGMLAKLEAMVAADAAVVHARGGNGQTPLHFASTVEIAAFLLDHAAEIDVLDLNHESTAAQHMLRVEQARHYPHDRQDVARYLVSRGCKTDLLMATALGDRNLVERHLDADPACIAMSVNEEWFPKKDPRAAGTIYISKLGANRTAHTVAREFAHEEIFQFLLTRTPDDLKMSLACELGDEKTFQAYLARHSNPVATMPEEERLKLPTAAQSNNTEAVRLMLQAGWPPNAAGEMGATALHWACFNGNAKMVREILRFHPDLEQKSVEYPGNALSWAIFASGNGWYRESGDFVGAVQALLAAGSSVPPDYEALEPSDAVLELLP